MAYEKCCTHNSKPMMPCSENKMRFELVNQHRKPIRLIQVDGCLITSQNTNKCDYLYEFYDNNDNINRVIYVELKGQDIEHAAVQIEQTMNYCKNRHKNAKKDSYIICSMVPKAGPKVQKMKVHFKSKLKSTLTVSTNKHQLIA